MISHKFLLAVVASGLLALATQTASAQATRTWVSGVGNDANPCSRTAPCKTFAGAISKTATGGEINALDPGGYGAVTITKSITIDGGAGQVASVLAAGTNGIVISAAGATVTLRNIRINGVLGSPTPGLNGVQILSAAAVHIENCNVFGFSQTGINVNLTSASAVRVFVSDTVVSNGSVGVSARNAGAGNLFMSVHRTTLVQNSSIGYRSDGSGGPGSIFNAISDSLVSGNGTGVSVVGGPSAFNGAQVTRSSVVNNITTGLLSNGTSGQASILASNTLVSGNGTGLSFLGGGNLFTYKNNSVNQNVVADGTFSSQITPQ
jgi:hypothetical protein